MYLVNKVLAYFNKGDARSAKAKKNIIALFIIKVINIGIGLLFVPLLINYLNPTKYGIWITLSSIIAWFGFFNIGLGNGLRNRLAEALAIGDKSLCKSYISTTYAIISIIFGFLFLTFFLANQYFNWSYLLNSSSLIPESELSNLALIVFAFFCLRFIFQIITSILMADQRPAFASVFDLVSKILLLISIILLKYYSIQSLQLFGALSSGLPVFVLICVTVWLYCTDYKEFRPSLSSIDLSLASSLFSLGLKFFFIQIAALILYQTNNILITQLFGPEHVTPYNVAFKYFSVLTMGFSIILAPFWSAFTDAWATKDFSWISTIMRKLKLIWVILLFAAIIMLISSIWVYSVWIGEHVTIPFYMSALVCIWIIINAWNGIYSHLLNGLGKIKLQMTLGLSAAVLNIPLAILLGKNIGILGILLANVIVSFPAVFIYPLQARKLLNNTASGIWNK